MKTMKIMSVDDDRKKVKWSLVKQFNGHEKESLYSRMTTTNQRNEVNCQAGAKATLGNVT